jgi:hypothetical protein
LSAESRCLIGPAESNITNPGSIPSYYSVARKVKKQREMEKYLEEIGEAAGELERMIR